MLARHLRLLLLILLPTLLVGGTAQAGRHRRHRHAARAHRPARFRSLRLAAAIGAPAVEPSERAPRASSDEHEPRASGGGGANGPGEPGASREVASSANFAGGGVGHAPGTDRSPRLDAPPTAPEPAIVERARPRDGGVTRERRWGLFGGGLALFASGYAVDVALTYGLGHQPAALSLIPLAGPLIQFGDNWNMVTPYKSGNAQVDVPANQRIDTVNRGIATAAYVVLGVDFALQLAGLTMAVIGAASSRTRSYAAAPASNRSWSLAPSGGGTALAVRF